jgi:hypothetical protein
LHKDYLLTHDLAKAWSISHRSAANLMDDPEMQAQRFKVKPSAKYPARRVAPINAIRFAKRRGLPVDPLLKVMRSPTTALAPRQILLVVDEFYALRDFRHSVTITSDPVRAGMLLALVDFAAIVINDNTLGVALTKRFIATAIEFLPAIVIHVAIPEDVVIEYCDAKVYPSVSAAVAALEYL